MQPVAPQITHDTWPKIIDAPLTLIFMMGHGRYCNPFCLYRQPKIPSWLTAAYRRCDIPGIMTKNRWRSVDAHFRDGAGRVLQSVLPIKAAKNTLMTDCSLSEVWFPRTHDQKSLMLRWRWFPWRGREGIAICFAYNGSQKIRLWVTTTYLKCDFPGRMTKNRWRSVDAHFAMAVSTICNHWI